MNKQLPVWKLVARSMDQKIPVMLLYVLESHGSSPGRQGFCMAVNAKKEMEGSVGGGIMEHKFVEMVMEKLREASGELREVQIRKQIHDKSAAKNQSGMICSGDQTILTYLVKERDRIQTDRIISCLNENKNATVQLSPAGVEFFEQAPDKDFQFEMKSEEDWMYKEKLGYKNRLFIIGGGHCALALSKLMSGMDFFIQVFDDRSDLHTMNQNCFAHQKKLVSSYHDLAELIPDGSNHYVVIMSFGYRTDEIALRAVLHKTFKYLGVLGSVNKVKKMMDGLSKEGVQEELIARIRTPVGLPIKSQTPEEIAVSIAAEIIQVKNN